MLNGRADQYLALFEQEAQLSQKNHAVLGVIEYFAKSHKVIRNCILRGTLDTI